MSADLLQQAIEDQRAGRLADAAGKLRDLALPQPADAAVIERLGFVHHAMGELPAAAEAFASLASDYAACLINDSVGILSPR